MTACPYCFVAVWLTESILRKNNRWAAARLSIDYCDNGQLVLFEDATHWLQHDEAENVNQYLLEFLL